MHRGGEVKVVLGVLLLLGYQTLSIPLRINLS